MIGGMRPRFIFSLALLAGTFASALAEIAARQITEGAATIMSAHDLWHILRPGSLVAVQTMIETVLHPWLWDPVLTTVLAFPAWLLLGLPGFLLLWRHSPSRSEGDIDEDALFLFDRLADRAREEGYGDDGGDPYVLPPRRADADGGERRVLDEKGTMPPATATKLPPYPEGGV